jgi:hypothetical protein
VIAPQPTPERPVAAPPSFDYLGGLRAEFDRRTAEQAKHLSGALGGRAGGCLRDAHYRARIAVWSSYPRGVERWNKSIARTASRSGCASRAAASPAASAFTPGSFADPDGSLLSEQEFTARRNEWLPTEADLVFVKSLMQRPSSTRARW